MKQKLVYAFSGLCSGILNGLFGAGGGIVSVECLKLSKIETKKAHATSVSIVLPLSLLSAFLYLNADAFQIKDALLFIPGGIVGAIIGAFVLSKVKAKWIRKLFGVVLIYSAVRMLR